MTDVTPASVVSLRDVTADNLEAVLRLAVAPHQRNFVADNATSIAQGHYHPHSWFRAIYADETSVGFAMLTLDRDKAEYYLWRFMIDQRYQKLGFGRRALQHIIAMVAQLPNARTLTLSFVPAEDGAEPFYRKLGFVPTGEMEEDEVVAALDLTARP